MADIFLSYASEDRERVIPLVNALQADGFSVWWDRNIRPGPSFDREIETAISNTGCMVVVWSEHSVESEWVRSEVEEGASRGILVPVLIDDVQPPLAHRRRQSANLVGWAGQKDGEYHQLLTGIKAVLEGTEQSASTDQTTSPATLSRRDAAITPAGRLRKSTTVSQAKALTLAGVCLLIGGVGILVTWIVMRSEPFPVWDSNPIRFTVPVGEGADVYLGGAVDTDFGRPSSTSLALSNDGRMLVYSAWETGRSGRDSRLYLRRLDQERAEPIASTEGGSSPFFSPDNLWVGFFVGSSLRRVPVNGGNADTIIADAVSARLGPRGATWGDDGTIVYGSYLTGGLYRVTASGGDAELVTEPVSPGSKFNKYTQPHLLPGSDGLLFHGITPSQDPEQAAVIALDLVTGVQTTLLTNAMDPRYVAETGHLLFMRQGSLMAVGFDSDRLALEGKPLIVEEDVAQAVGMPNSGFETGAAQVAISSSGHLAYARGGVYPERTTVMIRLTLDGEVEPFGLSAPRSYISFRVSPGGDRLAFWDQFGRGGAIHVHDLVRDVTQQLNTGGFRNSWPTWSPDGMFIAFSSDRDGVSNLYRIAADGSGEPERLAPSEHPQFMSSWSSQGVIAYGQGGDIWVLPPGEAPAPFFTSKVTETHASFSPDGRWLAYTVGGTNGYEVYVRPYPGPGPATLISGKDSGSPAWSRDGNQLYFLQFDEFLRREVMKVVNMAAGKPSPALSIIDPWIYGTTAPVRTYDVLADGAFVSHMMDTSTTGGRGAMREGNQEFLISELHVVINFFEELHQRVAN